jgi:hypothetical protein
MGTCLCALFSSDDDSSIISQRGRGNPIILLGFFKLFGSLGLGTLILIFTTTTTYDEDGRMFQRV